MTNVNAYAAPKANAPLAPFTIERRKPQHHDVEIDIQFCGVCHSDVHQVRNEWGFSQFPMVPGHEIVGIVVGLGEKASKYKIGDKVGVGCFVDSCRVCQPCKEGVEQYCEKGMSSTYNGLLQDGKTPTYGGYSRKIVVDENYVLKIPENIPLNKAAPLLCAGITTYSPLRHWQIKPNEKVGVVGLGGLGHMAVKLAAAMGAEVTVFSTSDSKRQDALRFGAKHFVNTKTEPLNKYNNTFDFIINTVSAKIRLEDYLNLLKRDKTMVLVGAPDQPYELNPFPQIIKRRSLAGSVIGGIKETQEMLDFCSEHNLAPEVEMIAIQEINKAYDRMVKGDVKYRFVIDIQSLPAT